MAFTGTDVPNGYCFVLPNGQGVMVEISPTGEIADEGNVFDRIKDSEVGSDMLSVYLVHSVRGAEQALIKILMVSQVCIPSGEHVPVFELARLGKLNDIVKKIWDLYMDGELSGCVVA